MRFGDDVLTYSTNNLWSKIESEVPDGRRSTRQPEGTVSKPEMHLVVQKGRTFQLEHPEVEVIFDKGRYLVVKLTKAKARKINDRDDVCFKVEPLSENTTVFETASPARSAAATGAPHARVVDCVQQAAFQACIEKLVSYPTRLSGSPHYREAAEWCRNLLSELGYSANLETVTMPGGQTSANVVARQCGKGLGGRGNVIVVAHLDSVNHPGGPDASAPGADDNASGSAGLLTLAAACSTFDFENDLTFVLFGGEEQGLHGSTQYVAALSQSERERIRAVLNMDMIGSVNSEPPTVLLEGHAISQTQISALAQSAADFTTLAVQTSLNPFASDHVPFIEAGIPAVLTIEGADGANSAIHTANDTLDRVRPEFAFQILRMNAGFVAGQAVLKEQALPVADGGQAAWPQHAGVDQARLLNELATHYNALFAQYARLGRDGMLSAQDYGNWQATRAAYDTLTAGKALGGCGCGCGDC
ncbi:M28 family metallopeptidase [Roseibium sp. M-1]